MGMSHRCCPNSFIWGAPANSSLEWCSLAQLHWKQCLLYPSLFTSQLLPKCRSVPSSFLMISPCPVIWPPLLMLLWGMFLGEASKVQTHGPCLGSLPTWPHWLVYVHYCLPKTPFYPDPCSITLLCAMLSTLLPLQLRCFSQPYCRGFSKPGHDPHSSLLPLYRSSGLPD